MHAGEIGRLGEGEGKCVCNLRPSSTCMRVARRAKGNRDCLASSSWYTLSDNTLQGTVLFA